jgi:hypothetical protein
MASFFFLFLIFAICLARGFSDDSFVEDTATTKLAKEEQQLISSPFVELFGKTLYRWKNNMIPDKDGNVEIEEISTAQLLSGKVAVAVYFSGASQFDSYTLKIANLIYLISFQPLGAVLVANLPRLWRKCTSR